jgi:hypothetical protein
MSDLLRDVLGDSTFDRLSRAGEIRRSETFWYHRPEQNFPPPIVQQPAAYDGSDRLALSCTQTSLPQTAQRKLVKEWCNRLPTLSNVKFLWLTSRATQDLFDSACRMPALTGLWIKWSGIKAIDSIVNLQTLKYLRIGSSPSLTGLNLLGQLPGLLWLELANIREMQDLGFLEGLRTLKGMALEGDTNSLKTMTVKTLGPIKHLQSLEWLALRSFQVRDGSLRSIANLAALKWLFLNNKFSMEQVATLAGAMPNVECRSFDPIFGHLKYPACKSCKGTDMVMLTGSGTKLMCVICDMHRIHEHAKIFRRFQAAGAAGVTNRED